MRLRLIFLLFGITVLSGQADSVVWKHYARGGLARADSSSGGFGYYRLNRQSLNTFNDLRLFGYNLENDSFIYIRYKSSNKYTARPHFYRYTTTSYRKNTRAKVALQYHFNQGLGYFIKDYKSGLINLEIGHAFDMSDYLNETRKTSYLKTGFFWDHDSRGFSTKIEIEHFQQISEIIESNLTRNQYLFEFVLPLKNGLSFNINYELEDYHEKGQNDASSVTMAFGWKGNLKWSL